MTTHPTALADQLQAASDDAHRRMLRAGKLPQLRLTHSPDVPAWLSEAFDRHALALLSGQGHICPHVGPAPRVVCAFAWAPGLLTCPGCRWLATPTDAEDSTCDRCRRHAETLYPTIAARGPILFGYGLCGTCHTTHG